MNRIDGEVFKFKKENEDVINRTDNEINERYKKGEIRIITEQARYPIKTIKEMIDSGDYKRNPEYQRRKRWDNGKKSRLIESFIMNVPLPPIFLYEYEYSKYEVMDGQQRLTAIHDFYNGDFILEGLEYWRELEGKKYNDLPLEIKKGIDRRYISSVVLLEETAKTEAEAEKLKQIVFERLNSGGEKLTAQESRNSLYSGKMNHLCLKLSSNEHFRRMWKIPLNEESLIKNDLYKKMTDVEYVLRFFAYRHLSELKTSKEKFFDAYLKKSNEFSDEVIDKLEQIFNNTINILWTIFGEEAFVPYNLEKPTLFIYDSLMQSISNYIEDERLVQNKDDIKNKIKSKELSKFEYQADKLLFDGRYDSNTIVLRRIKYFNKLIEDIINE